MVSAMDKSIGLLLAGLEELGLERDTLVVFTSDNGPEVEAGTAGRYKQSKRSLMVSYFFYLFFLPPFFPY